MNSMIRFEKVTKRLGGKKVLDRMDVDIQRGETFVIVGTSGAGKSVSLKHMIRTLSPDDGRVVIADRDVVSEARGAALSRIRTRFGVLFQSSALLQWMNVRMNVGLPLREKTNLPLEEIDKRVMEKLEMVNMTEALEKFPADLSGGMRKRVGLARALISEPEIILYDEPTSGLDPVISRQIDELINNLRTKLKVTSVVVTHDMQSALAVGSRIAMLNEGHLVEVATPEAFIRSENEEVRNFLESQYITKSAPWERR